MTTIARAVLAPRYGGPEVLEVREVEVPAPGAGEVTIEVRAAGLNPVDFKLFSGARGADPDALPLPVGLEVAGVLTAIGPDTEIASGGGAVGDEVLAFRISGGYASAVTVAAKDVFAKPASLGFPEAANLLLAGATASDMLHVTEVASGDTVLLHGASGAVGVAVLQLAARRGARVIGTTSDARRDVVERFGGVPVAYGDGLERRVRELAPDGVAVALDAIGTDEASDVSLALVADRGRIVTVANMARAARDGFQALGGMRPASAAYRDAIRPELIQLAANGDLVVPIGKTFPLTEAPAALDLLRGGHPGGKLALIP
jgi:NADPH:quinone reductase-like Zn-dependent oxidoreductase